jgi:hypothetical protein
LTQKLKDIFQKYPGRYKILLLVKNPQGFKKVITNFLVANTKEIKKEIEALLGKDSFRTEDYS